MKKIFFVFVFLSLPFFAGSHIGSPGVSFEGKAGGYELMVLVNPPDVIPGTATVDIYTSTSGILSIWAKPVYWYAGGEGTPEADQMVPVQDEPGHYQGVIWLMDAGTSGIEVEVRGETTSGKVLVPVMAVSTVQRSMDSTLGWILFCLCVLLVILMVTIIGASVSDGLVKPGEPFPVNIKRKKMTGVIASTVILITLLIGGKLWWDSWANNYRRYMYKPFRATTAIVKEANQDKLVFTVDTAKLSNLSFTRNISYIIPDHGKLMHMFMVRAESMDVFVHLHPRRTDSATFVTPVPPLPEGTYLIFADVTRVSGFSETIPDTFEIKKEEIPVRFTALDSPQPDPDDTYFITNTISSVSPAQGALQDVIVCGKPGIRTPLADGSSITWEQDPSQAFIANNLYSLKFNIVDETGDPALLEPYLGMAGHAVVMKADGSVYIHLHPVGSYSTASQQTMLTRFENEAGPVKFDKIPKPKIFRDSVDRIVAALDAMTEEDRTKVLMKNMNHDRFDSDHPEHSIVSFPYAFPSPGQYRIWIQIKLKGKILNSAFDVDVR